MPAPRVALVYDKLTTFGGAERVLLALHDLFPQAPIYTAVHHPQTAAWADIFPQIHTSFIQNLPFAPVMPQLYAALMPFAFERFDFTAYDVVISVTSYDAKNIITHPHTLHLCYCLTPNRYLWTDPGYNRYQHFGPFNLLVQALKSPLLSRLRLKDQLASTRPDHYLTISKRVQARINTFYHRDAPIIYPPVDTDFFQPLSQNVSSPDSPYFLIVSRLMPYKSIDLTIAVFNKLSLPLKIVGTGPDYDRLQSLIQDPQIQLLGFQTNDQLRDLYQHCQALVMPQEEDFGIVGLEALACGKPVISYRHSGIAELIKSPQTGLLFDHQTPQSLKQIINQFSHHNFSSSSCRKIALAHSLEQFKSKFKNHLFTLI